MIVEGGSFGFQIGASETDIVLLVMNDGGMKHLLSDKFTLGGDASAAAGPVGRSASAQTDVELNAEILSYSRSRGLFAGISLEGATLRPDQRADRELYGRDVTNREILTGDFKSPAAASKFERALHRDSAERSQ
jgi:lipid-binding SYLF domain-containing protein